MKTKNTKKVTLKILEKLEACESGAEYWKSLSEKHRHDPLWLMQHAIDSDNLHVMEHANWLITRLLSTKNVRRYAVFAARLALPVFESEYPNDDRPRKAIEAAEDVIKRNTAENREKARLAADAAWAAVVADVSCVVVDRSSWASWASWASRAAAYAAWTAAWEYRTADGANAAMAALAAADTAKTMIKILKYGMELLK